MFSSTSSNSGGPSICKRNARMVDFNKTHMLSSKLAQAGGWGGAAVNGGVQ